MSSVPLTMGHTYPAHRGPGGPSASIIYSESWKFYYSSRPIAADARQPAWINDRGYRLNGGMINIPHPAGRAESLRRKSSASNRGFAANYSTDNNRDCTPPARPGKDFLEEILCPGIAAADSPA